MWLRSELNKAENQGKLVVIFGHHPVRSMDSVVPDEATGECTGTQHSHGDTPEHDTNPGCDPDPRNSEPLHFGNPEQASAAGSDAFTFTELMANHPNVIAYVAGHTHEHQLLPCGSTRTSGPGNRRFCGDHLWWEINTSAVADWPHQHRLIEVMDNRDGTLSIFGTVLDHASPATAPAAGNASSFIARQLASIGRTFGFNDPQSGPPDGEGDPQLDQNVEMLVDDPRKANLKITKLDNPDPVRIGSTLTYTLEVENLGPFGATGVRVRDQLPSNVSFLSATATTGSCSASGATVNCALGDLAAGQKPRVTIRVRVQGDAPHDHERGDRERDHRRPWPAEQQRRPVHSRHSVSRATPRCSAPGGPGLRWPSRPGQRRERLVDPLDQPRIAVGALEVLGQVAQEQPHVQPGVEGRGRLLVRQLDEAVRCSEGPALLLGRGRLPLTRQRERELPAVALHGALRARHQSLLGRPSAAARPRLWSSDPPVSGEPSSPHDARAIRASPTAAANANLIREACAPRRAAPRTRRRPRAAARGRTSCRGRRRS